MVITLAMISGDKNKFSILCNVFENLLIETEWAKNDEKFLDLQYWDANCLINRVRKL